MNLDEAKQQFITTWGTMGSNWGVNRTMAQLHALMLISNEPLSTEDIMAQLNISRGNANMNIRALIDWGLVEKLHKLGERKEFFQAEKDLWKVATRIAKERRKRELAPILDALDDLRDINDPEANPNDIKKFTKQMDDLEGFTGRVDDLLERLVRADEHWFLGIAARLLKK